MCYLPTLPPPKTSSIIHTIIDLILELIVYFIYYSNFCFRV